MKDNNMMMWVLGAAMAWWLYSRGTLDPYLDPIINPLQEGFKDFFPGDTVVVNGNGEAVVVNGAGVTIDAGAGNGNGSALTTAVVIDQGGIYLGNNGGGISENGVSGIADWGDIYN